jgi:hypothetical protein
MWRQGVHARAACAPEAVCGGKECMQGLHARLGRQGWVRGARLMRPRAPLAPPARVSLAPARGLPPAFSSADAVQAAGQATQASVGSAPSGVPAHASLDLRRRRTGREREGERERERGRDETMGPRHAGGPPLPPLRTARRCPLCGPPVRLCRPAIGGLVGARLAAVCIQKHTHTHTHTRPRAPPCEAGRRSIRSHTQHLGL